jgi:hypothetical protein
LATGREYTKIRQLHRLGENRHRFSQSSRGEDRIYDSLPVGKGDAFQVGQDLLSLYCLFFFGNSGLLSVELAWDKAAEIPLSNYAQSGIAYSVRDSRSSCSSVAGTSQFCSPGAARGAADPAV